MEDEFPKKRNVRPVEKSNLPLVTLSVLILLVLAMLYVGYEYISDNSSNADELTAGAVEITGKETDSGEPIPEVPVTVSKESTSKKSDSDKEKEEEKKAEPAKEKTPAISASSIGGQQITHSVKKGETFSSIASRYNLKAETVKGLNSSVDEVKSGSTKLKIQVKAIHTVGPGDVLRVVATKYGVTKEAIMKANGKTKDYAARGEKLIIPFPSKK